MFSTLITSLKAPFDEAEQKNLPSFEFAVSPESFPNGSTLTLEQKKANLQIALTNLKKISQIEIIRFSMKSPILTNFFETNEEFKQKWIAEIRLANQNRAGLGTPDVEVKSGFETHSIFDHYRSSFFMDIFEEPKGEQKASEASERVWLLDKAIEWGSFEGLAVKCAFDVKKILKNTVLSEEKTDKVIKTNIMPNIERLCKLYGVIGYLYAAKELFELAELFVEDKSRRFAMYDEAVKYVLSAYLLREDSNSNYLFNVISKSEDHAKYLRLISPLSNVTSWDEAIIVLRDRYREKAEFDKIQDNARAEVASRDVFLSKVKDLKSPLRQEEKEIENAIYSLSEADASSVQYEGKLNRIISQLDKCSQEAIVRLSLNSNVIKEFCETNIALQKKWADEIKAINGLERQVLLGIPDSEVRAADGSEVHSLFDHYRSAYYIRLYKLADQTSEKHINERLWLLKEASQLGALEALEMRIKLLVDSLLIVEDRAKLNEMIENNVMKNVQRICNLYGAVGYIRSANELFRLGLHLDKQQTDALKTIGADIFNVGTKNVLCASFLRNDSAAMQLQSSLLKGNSIFSLFRLSKLKGKKTWQEVREALRTLYTDPAQFQETVKQAKKEVSLLRPFSAKFNDLQGALSENEKRIIRETEGMLQSENTSAAAIDTILKWRQETIVRFALKSEVLRSLFENNKVLHQKWINDIREINANSDGPWNTPDVEVKARNNSEAYSIFDHYRSDFYVTLYKEGKEEPNETKEKEWLLNESAQIGSFEAMALKCQQMVDNICRSDYLPEEIDLKQREEKLSAQEKKALKDKIFEKKISLVAQDYLSEAKRLFKLYGAVGYLYSANQLNRLFIYFYRNAKTNYARIIAAEAASQVVCASYLAQDAYSLQCQRAILKEASLFSLLNEFKKYSNDYVSTPNLVNATTWDEVKAELSGSKGYFAEMYIEIERRAERELERLNRAVLSTAPVV